jgi:pimeloyl-ACP methyl ester carboxylesterase
LGTPTAYAYAAAYPEEISRFVFIEGGIPGFGLEDFMDVKRGGKWHFGFFMAPKIPAAKPLIL